MAKKKYINSFDYKSEDFKGEVNKLPTVTVPDMTMSLKEILKRYTRGGEIATLTPVYQQGEDFDENPDISKMDATEKLQYAKDIREAIAEHQNRSKAVKPVEKPAPDKEGKSEGEAKREPEAEPDVKEPASKEKQ